MTFAARGQGIARAQRPCGPKKNPEALSLGLKQRRGLAALLWDGLAAAADVTTPERRAKFNAEIVKAAAKITDPAVRKAYEGELAAALKSFEKAKGLKPMALPFEKPGNAGEAKPKDGKKSGREWDQDSLDDMNKRYAVVIMGQRAAILMDSSEDVGGQIERIRFMNVDAFRLWLANKKIWAGSKLMGQADLWLEDYRRRQYRGMEFMPAPPGRDETRDGFFNLWRGFEVAPAANPDLAKPWLDHVLENVVAGDAKLYQWVVSWFAWMVQHPRKRSGVSLALRGGMGSGKTITGKIFGSLFPANYFLIDDPRYLTGQFNSHLASCLFLQADEGFWAGDKTAEGRLKGLVTSDFQMIEYKGIDPIRLPNYVNLMISSNEEWVVPAGLRERRFAVIDMATTHMQDTGYFKKLDELYQKPEAKAALLAALAAWPIDEQALRKVPNTEALWTQKVRSFDSFMGWLLELLSEAAFVAGGEWPLYHECHEVHNHYLKRCEKLGLRHPLSSHSFGRRLRSILPDVRRAQKGGKKWCYVLPELNAARQTLSREVDYLINWDGDGSFEINEEPVEPM